MAMSKKRRAVYDKSGGHCFYCGEKLGEKGWHEDHFHPIIRGSKTVECSEAERKKTGFSHKLVNDGTCAYPELDSLVNKVPSCAPCNNFKASYTIEGYRKAIENQFESTLKASSGLRQLLRLGLIDMGKKPIIFWFERQGIQMPTRSELMGLNPKASTIRYRFDRFEGCYIASIEHYTITFKSEGDDCRAMMFSSQDNDSWGVIFKYESHANLCDKVADWALSIIEDNREKDDELSVSGP